MGENPDLGTKKQSCVATGWFPESEKWKSLEVLKHSQNESLKPSQMHRYHDSFDLAKSEQTNWKRLVLWTAKIGCGAP